MVRTTAGTLRSRRSTKRARPLVACVFGTRPQLIKLAAVWRQLDERASVVLIDSGQHYDHPMAGTFYKSKQIRPPDINLGIRAPSAGLQVARIADALNPVFSRRKPAAVVTFGDTSTTAGAAIAAAYLNIPLAHIEAGLRSNDLRSAEEKNRVLTDCVSSWLFCPTQTAIDNLKREGITSGVYGVGDVLYESFREMRAAVDTRLIKTRFGMEAGQYYVLTCHRAETVDDPKRLQSLVQVLELLDRPVLFPVHPRARKSLIRHRLWKQLQCMPHVTLIQPLDHLESLTAIAGARAVLTDSGGVQREAYWSGTPCLTLRDRTEWTETVDAGANRVVDLDWHRIARALKRRWTMHPTADPHFRKTRASRRIVDILIRDLLAV